MTNAPRQFVRAMLDVAVTNNPRTVEVTEEVLRAVLMSDRQAERELARMQAVVEAARKVLPEIALYVSIADDAEELDPGSTGGDDMIGESLSEKDAREFVAAFRALDAGEVKP